MVSSLIGSYNIGLPSYCVSCCVNSGISGPGIYGPFYCHYMLVHPVKLEAEWGWEYAILCRKCEMIGKLKTDCEDLCYDWCDGCVQVELKRLGADGKVKQGAKRKHDDADEHEDEHEKLDPKKMRMNKS